jgi:hypothetical protein
MSLPHAARVACQEVRRLLLHAMHISDYITWILYNAPGCLAGQGRRGRDARELT